MLKDRQKSILYMAVEEYIKTAHPVGSAELIKNTRLNLSSATVRNEMCALDKMGYLEQPHTSAGRTPTDRGYRFFVDNLLSDIFLEEKEEEILEKAFEIKVEEEFIREFGKVIAHLAQTFTAVGSIAEDFFYETGFSYIMREPELSDPDSAKKFGRLIDFLDEELLEIFKSEINFDDEERVFIGRENPLKEAEEYSMLMAPWQHPRGFSGFFTLIGPKRTNYLRHKALVQSIKKIKGT